MEKMFEKFEKKFTHEKPCECGYPVEAAEHVYGCPNSQKGGLTADGRKQVIEEEKKEKSEKEIEKEIRAKYRHSAEQFAIEPVESLEVEEEKGEREKEKYPKEEKTKEEKTPVSNSLQNEITRIRGELEKHIAFATNGSPIGRFPSKEAKERAVETLGPLIGRIYEIGEFQTLINNTDLRFSNAAKEIVEEYKKRKFIPYKGGK